MLWFLKNIYIYIIWLKHEYTVDNFGLSYMVARDEILNDWKRIRKQWSDGIVEKIS